MAIENNTMTTVDVAKLLSVDFTNTFKGGIDKLLELFQAARTMPVSSGTNIKFYKAEGTLVDGAVAEGDVVPLSGYKLKELASKEIKLKKWRKSVTKEAIQRSGFDAAMAYSNDAMVKDIQKAIRKEFFDTLKTGTGKGKGKGLQGALATSWGLVQTIFEDDGAMTIVFANPEDVAEYIGQANITMQEAFGLTFLTGFTNTIVVTNTNVPKGTLYATAPQNIVLAYVPMGANEYASMETGVTAVDESGYIASKITEDDDRHCFVTHASSWLMMFAERLDGVFAVTIEKAAATGIGG